MTEPPCTGSVRLRRTSDWAESQRWTLFAITASLALLAGFARIGGDWDWMIAMGDYVRAEGTVPDSVPFAEADTSGWHNVPLLAQLVTSIINDVGGRSAVFFHLGAVALTLSILASTARSRGASDGVVAGVIAAVVLGSLPALVIVRAQTYSLVLFALLVALVASQSRRPDPKVWWAVPLILVWGNLHGAALLGVCVLGAYLLFGRLRTRPRESLAVGIASLAVLCVTPQLWNTPLYYYGVFDNVSAQRAEGLWARPSLNAPLDVLMLVIAGLTLVQMLRFRRKAWEYVAVLGLCLATVSAARHGVWLLFLLAIVSAGRQVRREENVTRDLKNVRWALSVVPLATVALVVAVPVAAVRGDAVLGAPPEVVTTVSSVAEDRVVLAPAPLSEALAVAGVRLWAGNPLDAFAQVDQAAYLDFLDGSDGARDAVAEADVVVVQRGSPQAAVVSDDPKFVATPCAEDWICYVRR